MKSKYKRKLVTVIIPTYNSVEYIEETLNSVFRQTYNSLELIIVDDYSSDNTVAKIEQLVEEKISKYPTKVISLTTNVGAAKSRNIGLQNAQGQYVAFLDADDVWESNKIESQINFMENHKYAFTFTSYYRKNENGKTINLIRVPEKIDYNGLLKNTIIGCSTVVIDRAVVGDFSMPLLRKGQDTATWLFLLKERVGYAYGLDSPLTQYTVRKNSISYNKFGALKRTWDLYRKVEKLHFLKAIYNYSFYIINAFVKRQKNSVKG